MSMDTAGKERELIAAYEQKVMNAVAKFHEDYTRRLEQSFEEGKSILEEMRPQLEGIKLDDFLRAHEESEAGEQQPGQKGGIRKSQRDLKQVRILSGGPSAPTIDPIDQLMEETRIKILPQEQRLSLQKHIGRLKSLMEGKPVNDN